MMKTNLSRLLSIVILCYTVSGYSQNYKARSVINPVKDSGFYKILLAPQYKAFAGPELENLRIMESSHEIPYIIEKKPGKRTAVQDFHYTMRTDETKKISYVDIVFDYPTSVNGMALDISSPKLYRRNAALYYIPFKQEEESRNEKEESLELLIHAGILDTISLGGLYVKKMRMEIVNEDNWPLVLDSIYLFQQTDYLICSMSPGKTYELVWLDVTSPAPSYDLKYFRDRIGEDLPFASLGDIRADPHAVVNNFVSADKENKPSNWFLWTCIGIGGLAVLLFARALLRDMKKE